jgi:hypothetical protein
VSKNNRVPDPRLHPPAVAVDKSESTHAFVQFRDVIAVEDSRGQEELTDRARVGLPLGPHGVAVTGIALRDGWFLIATERRSYEVPVSNIRSARR